MDPAKQPDELHTVLSAMVLMSGEGDDWSHASDIARYLHNEHGVELHWRRIQALLDNNKTLVSRRKRRRRWQYNLLKAGKNAVKPVESDVVFIDPSKAVQNVVAFHKLLESFAGAIQLCDPYIDPTSIEHLDALPLKVQVRYLTFNVREDARLRRIVAAYRSSDRGIEIRRTAKATIHDRYLIDNKSMVILGTSLNGFGKKESFVIRVGQDVRRVMLAQFDQAWASASRWH